MIIFKHLINQSVYTEKHSACIAEPLQQVVH